MPRFQSASTDQAAAPSEAYGPKIPGSGRSRLYRLKHLSSSARPALNRIRPFLARTDADDLIGWDDKDLAIADLAGPRILQDRVDDLRDFIVGHENLDLYLR